MGCEAFCTAAKCNELEERINYLENLINNLEQKPGLPGPPGERGEKGERGEQGLQGERGEKGERGEQGLQGERGEKGDRGEQGLQGERGEKGQRGEDGYTPIKGFDYFDGERGFNGYNGERGEKGEKGEDGISIIGPPGPKGDKGDPGITPDLTEIVNDITIIKTQLGSGSMSLQDIGAKLDDIISKIADCCTKVENNGNGITEVGTAVSSVGDAVSTLSSDTEEYSQVLGTQVTLAREECKSGFTLIDLSQRNQNTDIGEILNYLHRIEEDTITIKTDTFVIRDVSNSIKQDTNDIKNELVKQDNIFTGSCSIDPVTGIKSFNPTANNRPIDGLTGFGKEIIHYLIDIHRSICQLSVSNNPSVYDDRVWKLLGGGTIFNADVAGNILPQTISLEDLINSDTNTAYLEQEDPESKGKLEIKNFVDYVRAMATVNHYRSGHNEYPLRLPEDLTMSELEIKEKLQIGQNQSLDLANLSEEQEDLLAVNLETDLDYQIWLQRNLFESIGRFPFKITLAKDSLLLTDIDIKETSEFQEPEKPWEIWKFSWDTKYEIEFKASEADQVLEFSSIADSFAEIVGLLLSLATNEKLNKELITRILLETASIRKTAITTYANIESMQAFLGYNHNYIKDSYWSTFDPDPRETNDQTVEMLNLLKPKKLYYQKNIYSGKSGETLASGLVSLLHAASIIRAQYFTDVDVNGDVLGIIKTNFENGKNLVNEVLKNDKENPTEDNPDRTDFDEYLEIVEEGFGKTIGDIDQDGNTREPYGRARKERPKIQRFKGDPVDE